MIDGKNASHNPRFFSESSIVKEVGNENKLHSKDPTPFGLDFQEKFAANASPTKHGPSMYPSPTNMPGGPDSSVDFDIEF